MTNKEKIFRSILYLGMAIILIVLGSIRSDGAASAGAGILILLTILVWRF